MKEVTQRFEIGRWGSVTTQFPGCWMALRHSSLRLAWELRREWAKCIMQTASLTELSNHRHCHLLGGLIRVPAGVGGAKPGVRERASGWDADCSSISQQDRPSFLLPLFWSGLGGRDLLIYKSNCVLICETYSGEFHPFFYSSKEFRHSVLKEILRHSVLKEDS